MLLNDDHPSIRFRQLAILLILLVAAHFPLLLNNDLLMDDWLLLKPRPDYTVDLAFMLHGAGHPVFYGYFTLANWTGVPIQAMQALTLASILIGGTCVALIVSRLRILTPLEAVAAALTIWTYPAYRIWAGKANTVYVFSFSLFFIGAWLLTLCFGAKGVKHVLLRCAAALVFFFSFALNSTMVLYAFAMMGLFIATLMKVDAKMAIAGRLLTAAFRTVVRFPEFVVLPLIYWAILNIWFARVGVYATHYNVRLPTLLDIADGFRAFFMFGYVRAFSDAAKAILGYPSLFAASAVLVVGGLLLSSKDHGSPKISSLQLSWPVAVATIIFIGISAPYIIVGLRPSEHFYESRHLLLFGVPLALVLLALKRSLERVITEKWATTLVFGSALILAFSSLWNNYALLQARGLKQEALSSQLAGLPKPDALVFGLADGFLGRFAKEVPFGIPELSGILRLAWGNEPFLGFSRQAEQPFVLRVMECNRTAEGSAFSHIRPTGPQANISLQPGPAAGPAVMVARRYYACRLFGQCDVSDFVRQQAQVEVNVGPIPNVLPTNDLHCAEYLRGEVTSP